MALVYFVPEAPYERVVVLLSGGWAMVPDIVKLGFPVDTRVAMLVESVWANVFWFHERIDAIDAGNSLPFAAAMVGAFILVTFVAERWDYAVAEHVAADEPVMPGRSLSFLRAILGVGCLGAAGLLVVEAFVVESLAVLYIGTAAALGLAGMVVLLVGPAVADAREPWSRLPDWARTLVQLGVTFGTVIVASGLLTSLRTVDPLDAVYVGTALLLVTLLSVLATHWS